MFGRGLLTHCNRRGGDVGVRRAVELRDLDSNRGLELGGEVVKQSLEITALHVAFGAVRLAVDVDVEHSGGVDADVGDGKDDGDLHSPSTGPSRRAPVSTRAGSLRGARASRSSPGGLPSPTFGV
jgi:hypothetical protein